jgi:hypothetical protein
MDKELHDFEAELTRLQPAAPSRALEQRIERELRSAPVSRSHARVSWVWFVALPAAAAVAILLSRPDVQLPARERTAAQPPPAAEVLKPVAAENVLYSARDEGLVELEDGTPARRERLQFVDTITWKNPRTNASLRWTVPREEVRVVPISFQ